MNDVLAVLLRSWSKSLMLWLTINFTLDVPSKTHCQTFHLSLVPWLVSFLFVVIPVNTSLGIHLGIRCRSSRGVKTPSKFPNIEDKPRLKSMTKNSTAHTWEPGIFITASVNTIKARPVPEALCKAGRQVDFLYIQTLSYCWVNTIWDGVYLIKKCFNATVP